MRPSVDEVWMEVAIAISRRSRCSKAQVGAVVVSAEGRVESTGYNGPPAGLLVLEEQFSGAGCARFCERARTGDQSKSYGISCPSVHAEANALLYTDRSRIEGGTIYASRSCCADCAKLIANSGIKRVVMRVLPEDAHRDPNEIAQFLQACGLVVVPV